MKNALKSFLIVAALLPALGTQAYPFKQDTTKKLSTKIKSGLTKVGHKTSQIAATGAAAVVDKKYEGKSGPNGETIYINKNSHYYYINTAGHKVFVAKAKLLNKSN